MNTIRLTTLERTAFMQRGSEGWRHDEPALGTLDERLGIIVRRQGGRTAPATLGLAERREYARWLVEHAPDSINPYASKS